MVRIAAFQAVGPGSIPGCRIFYFDINNINNRKDTELLNAIEFHYYSKSYTNKKEENKEDNKGIKLIKEFVETLYKEMTMERNKKK